MFVWLFCRSLNSTVGVFPRPLLDLSAKHFAKIFDDAFGHKLVPPFDPYRDSLSYMLSCYVIPYVGLVGYVGTNPNINGYETKRVSKYIFYALILPRSFTKNDFGGG